MKSKFGYDLFIDWHERVGRFLALVDKTLTTGVQFKDLRINIVEIEKE